MHLLKTSIYYTRFAERVFTDPIWSLVNQCIVITIHSHCRIISHNVYTFPKWSLQSLYANRFRMLNFQTGKNITQLYRHVTCFNGFSAKSYTTGIRKIWFMICLRKSFDQFVYIEGKHCDSSTNCIFFQSVCTAWDTSGFSHGYLHYWQKGCMYLLTDAISSNIRVLWPLKWILKTNS